MARVFRSKGTPTPKKVLGWPARAWRNKNTGFRIGCHEFDAVAIDCAIDAHRKGCISPVAKAQSLNCDYASSAKHGPPKNQQVIPSEYFLMDQGTSKTITAAVVPQPDVPAVDDLSLAEPEQGSGLLGQTTGVESVVAANSKNTAVSH